MNFSKLFQVDNNSQLLVRFEPKSSPKGKVTLHIETYHSEHGMVKTDSEISLDVAKKYIEEFTEQMAHDVYNDLMFNHIW